LAFGENKDRELTASMYQQAHALFCSGYTLKGFLLLWGITDRGSVPRKGVYQETKSYIKRGTLDHEDTMF